jgi:DNA-binding NarL/FixJ family response regulator
MGPPVSVALLNDYEVVVRGVAAMLEPYAERVRVVELSADGSAPHEPVDVALLDTFSSRRDALDRARAILDQARARAVVLYTWEAVPDLCERALEAGLSGVVAKSVPAERLVRAIERVAAGDTVVDEGAGSVRRASGFQPPSPLSERETEVLVLVAQGLTNRQIADELYLSPETVKTYVSRLYAKLGVSNRASAVVWAMERDLGPPVGRARSVLEQVRAQG